MKSTQLFLCPPNPSLSTHFCNFICQDSEVLPLFSLESFFLSSCFLVPLLLSQWGFPACNLLLAVVLHIRSVSHLTRCPSAFCSFPSFLQFIAASPTRWDSQELTCHGNSELFLHAGFLLLLNSSMPYLLGQAAPILHCGGKSIYPGVRIKYSTVKYQTLEDKGVTQICR